MKRLTTNKNISDMGMLELAHNCCYCKDGNARYRDFEIDMDARDLARELMVQYRHWKSCEEYGYDADNELLDNDIFDDTMVENLIYGPNEDIGLIALFYRNLWAMADLRERLKAYEDAEEQRLLFKLPCKVGDIVYLVDFEENSYDVAVVESIELCVVEDKFEILLNSDYEIGTYAFADYVFYSQEGAEQALKEMESEG